ncbi:MAG: hypothetical protein KGL69_03200 [Alphaproteobacteria bacterium]|nr:hypothetical protein [Alphaproteobacteria bacterium]
MRALRSGVGLACAALATLQACATPERLAAAGDVHALLVSIRDDDRAGFDAHIDRTALEAEVQAVLMRRAARLGAAGTGLGVLASGPLAHAAGTLLLRPDTFRAIAYAYGYQPGAPLPHTLALATALRPSGSDQVCAVAPRTGACLLTFAREDGVWRLVAFDAHRILDGAPS